MALSYDTEGYSFNPQFASGGEAALGELKPLQLASSAGKLSFIAPKPPTPVNTPPEAVGQAVAQGLGELGKGITAAYKAKGEKKEKALAEGRKKAPFAMGFSEDPELGLVPKAGAVDPSVDAVAFNAKIDELQKHIANSVGTGGKKRKAAAGGAADDSGLIGLPPVERRKPVEGGSITTPETPEGTPGSITIPEGTETPGGIRIEGKPLGVLPPPDNRTAQVSDENPLGISFDPQYLTASTESGPTGPMNPAGAWQPVKPEQIDIGHLMQGISLSKLPPVTAAAPAAPALAEAPAPVEKDPKLETYVNVKGPYTKDMAMALQAYAEKTGRGRPIVSPPTSRTKGYMIDWASGARQAAKEEKAPAAAAKAEATQQTQAKRLDLQAQRVLDAESSKFYQHPSVKAFTAANGMQQSFPRFVKNYDAVGKHPEAAGISDIGLLDMYARAEGGGRVTEGQAALVLQSMGLADKAKVLGMALEGGDKLGQNQRDQMMRVIADDHVAQARLANQAVKFYRDRLRASGVTDEGSLPQFYVTPITKWEAKDQLEEMRKEALALKAQKDAAARSGADATEADIKLTEIGHKAQELAKKMRSAKSMVINMDEIENTPQGWGGGAVMAIPTLPTAPAGQ